MAGDQQRQNGPRAQASVAAAFLSAREDGRTRKVSRERWRGNRFCRCLERHGPIEAVDHRRHELSQERAAIRSGGGSTILRASFGKAGQLSGHGDACRWPITLRGLAGGLSAVICRRSGVRDRKRRAGKGREVPDEISFKTKPEIALAQNPLGRCRGPGYRAGRCLMDAGLRGSTLICARAFTGLGA